MPSAHSVKLRPLEREDLRYVHQLDNNASVMRYWFEEPYEAFVELSDLYDKHIHDQSERRFVVECDGEKSRSGGAWWKLTMYIAGPEFQIIISPEYQGKGLATRAAKLAMDYGFTVLNLYKLYLIVDKENEKAIHIYRKLGFTVEGELMHEFFINGQYRNAIRMCIFQHSVSGRAQNTGSDSPEADRTIALIIIDRIFDGVNPFDGGFYSFINNDQLTVHRIGVTVIFTALFYITNSLIIQ
ncbi:spermidine N1-acetyltransferase [Escherichia coli]|uniref:Spermidine N(1)-acetyltransferase n=1 Tax=Escherichia coli TaxID=562 RepID=A0A376KVK4_ECOLX|nr:spermidine N1-acetyltransferase [Escherichia coli]